MSKQSILPLSSTPLEKDLERMGLLATDLGALDLSMIHDPFRCPPSMLAWLAYSRHVDNYNEAWPEHKKRSVIAGSPQVHLIKGTIKSVRDVIRFAGYGEIEIITQGFNWFYNGVRRYNGTIQYGESSDLEWAQYRVRLQSQVTQQQAQIIRGLLNATAPARCELIGFEYTETLIYNGQHVYNGEFSYGAD